MGTRLKICSLYAGMMLGLTFTFFSGQLWAQAPAISYTTPQNFTVGVVITPLNPSNNGGAVAVNGQTSTLAGSGTAGYADGTGSAASFNVPVGIAEDASGNLYVADALNYRIRKITPAGVVSTFAGSGTRGHADGTGTAAMFMQPYGLAIDGSGNLYVADEIDNCIRKITPAGVVTTVAGNGTAGYVDGAAASAEFSLPSGVAVDASGNIYVADQNNNMIRKISTTGTVSTFAGSGTAGSANGTGTAASFYHPFDLKFDRQGNLFVTDWSNHLIRKITSAGVVTTFAGNGTYGHVDGTGTAAELYFPTALAIDAGNNIYFADELNNMVRQATSSGVVTTIAGTGANGSANGAGNMAAFYNPCGITVDSLGYVSLTDYRNELIRKVAVRPFVLTAQLPVGLSFNTTTGAITGTPTTATSAANYSVTAYNGSGLSTAALSIAVNSYSGSLSGNMNYVITQTPRVSGITNDSTLAANNGTNTKVQVSVQYVDGLGRPVQTVQKAASPLNYDIVSPQAYDQYGREVTKYLPYTPQTGTSGSYRPNAVSGDQTAFYASPPSNSGVWVIADPYAQTAFDNSPFNRPVEQGAPGVPWQLTGVSGGGHTVKMNYTVNNSTSFTADSVNSRQVAMYYVTINSNNTRSVNAGGYYAAGTLTVTVSKDENWTGGRAGTVEEYKDIDGQVVLKRQYNYSPYNGVTALQVLSTYYVYDDLGHLAFVLPPQANGDAAAAPSAAVLNNLCYQYQYDERGRPIGKKLPGKGWEYVVYNVLDQPVATQDSLQRAANQWVFTKYDGQQRPILTGIWNNGGTAISRSSLQSTLNGISTNLYETAQSTGNGYTNVAWPTTNVTATLTLDYYDSYANVPGLPATYTLTAGVSQLTRGLPVAKKTAVLNTPANQLWDVIYYDDLGRTTNTYSQHYLGGVLNNGNYDAVTTTYNFTNQPTTVTRNHWNTVSSAYPLVTVANWYIYDQVGRKRRTWEQITNGNSAPTTKTLVSNLNYNEVGQVKNKQLHSTDSLNYLQTIPYGYNERGWLTSSTAPLFNMTLYYNTGSVKAYNGNIMYQYWGSGGTYNKIYIYNYDKLNRLMYGVMQLGSGGAVTNTEQGIGYDLNGNFKQLIRYAGTTSQTEIDALEYSYNDASGNYTNQVKSINDLSGNNSGLPNGTTTYTYDGNGNELSASNTANTGSNKSFTYNLLNLPQTATTPNGTVTYTYDALGNKLRKVSVISGVTKTTDYISGIEYDGATTDTLNFIQTEEGKAAKTGSNSYDYTYYLGDNLGNTRVTFGTKTGAAVVYQSDDYYPFGMEISNSVSSPKNEYLFNKKELQEELNEYDYGARFYDPVIARWNTIDPLAEISRRWSPYNYVENNPIRLTDPDGMYTEDAYGNLQFEGKEAQNYFRGLKNAVGKAVSTALTFGGVGGDDKNKGGGKKGSGDDAHCCVTRPDASATAKSTSAQQLSNTKGPLNPNQAPPAETVGQHQEPVNYNDAGLPSSSQMTVGSAWDAFQVVDGGFAIKGLFSRASFEAFEGGLNLFKFGSEQALASEGWKAGDYFLFLRNLGSPKLNWAQNSSILRGAMREGKPIFETFIKADGALQPTGGFLNAERNLLQNSGWTYNQGMRAWMPPK
jgi:RHS repeat-associated protein